VIVGALFKIMHFPGAGPMLIAGMSIEAILFAIGCLDRPHADFHWENVFPQLVGHGADPELIKEMESRPRPTLLGGAGTGESSTVPAVDEKVMESLKLGIAGLAKTASQLSELGTLATATTNLTSKLDAAGVAAEQFVAAGKVMTEKSTALGETYAQVTTDGYIAVPLWFFVGGTVEVSKTENNKLYVEINAINSYDQPIKIVYDGTGTGVENIEVENITGVKKMMVDGQLVIIRNGEAFNATGARVK
jgi:hypothetical protein